MTESSLIKLPDVPAAIEISGDWLTKRDQIVAQASNLKAIRSADDFEAASELLRAITKADNKMEAFRKDFGKPFLEATRMIKNAADKARQPLGVEKTRIKLIMGSYSAEQDRIRREEEKRIQQEQQAEAEKRLAANAVLGIEDEVVLPEAPKPDAARPVVDATRTVKRVDFEVADPETVPRAFMSVDEKKIRAFIAERKDKIISILEDDPKMLIIEGVKMHITHSVQAR